MACVNRKPHYPTGVIELRNLQKVIEQNPVLDIPALEVTPGACAAVVGPVGSGKEALLDLLLGRSRPTTGTVRLAGVDPAAEKAQFGQKVGVLFADDSLYQQQSARGNLHFHCRLHGLPKSRADDVLALVGLADHAEVRAERLPSGLARRLAFGRALLHRPAAFVLVEPFARCDGASIALLSRLIHDLITDNAAVLILADTPANLTTLCDPIYLLEHGRLTEAFQPPPEQARSLPFKIPVRLEDRVVLLNPADILYAEAQGDRALLQTAAARLTTQFTLTELEERLARSGFFRAHRSFLVNLQHVKEIIPYTRSSFSLVLNDAAGTEIPLSKAAAADLRELLGY